ncbi:MAG: hypothetical protein IJ593_11070 [Lachnospiraceae bacterium]|nr:hypothetical protein [Lachnospiraceae bacterium]
MGYSKELVDLLSTFMLKELGHKAMYGITYTFVLKNKENKKTYDDYMSIRKEADKCGFERNEVFRVYEVSNGYIFDMDVDITKTLLKKLNKALQNIDGQNNKDISIEKLPAERRKDAMLSLGKYCVSEFEKGNKDITVALFSRNYRKYISVAGKDKESNQYCYDMYNAYGIRHWDIEAINHYILIPAGIRISVVEPFEILPTLTGVRFGIHMEAV